VWTGEEGEVEEDNEETEDNKPQGKLEKITLENASMNKPYSNGSYKADWAIKYGGSKTAIAAIGAGNWW
jgi:hypothetical protein